MSNKYISEQSNQFKNKIIIVTGSTQGSGAETAKLLANRGAKGITICGRNNKNGNKVKSEIESIGAECLYVQADLEKLEDCKKIVSETDKKFSTVDSFINVAAFTERGTILSTTEENFDKNFSSLTLQEKPKLKKPPLYKVIMLNDDYTPMEFVVYVLQKFFNYDQERATQIMLAVHTHGKGVCGIFTKEIAETKSSQINDFAQQNEHPLLSEIEPVDDED